MSNRRKSLLPKYCKARVRIASSSSAPSPGKPKLFAACPRKHRFAGDPRGYYCKVCKKRYAMKDVLWLDETLIAACPRKHHFAENKRGYYCTVCKKYYAMRDVLWLEDWTNQRQVPAGQVKRVTGMVKRAQRAAHDNQGLLILRMEETRLAREAEKVQGLVDKSKKGLKRLSKSPFHSFRTRREIPPHILSIAENLAKILGEESQKSLLEIASVVAVLGESKSRALVDDAQRVQSQGGITTRNGVRLWTLGRVFLYMAEESAGKISRR